MFSSSEIFSFMNKNSLLRGFIHNLSDRFIFLVVLPVYKGNCLKEAHSLNRFLTKKDCPCCCKKQSREETFPIVRQNSCPLIPLQDSYSTVYGEEIMFI